MILAAGCPGRTALKSWPDAGCRAIVTLCHPAPLTEYLTANEPMPSGSVARTDTVTGCVASGMTGVCPRFWYVGPMFETNREFTAPGVPFNVGTVSEPVRASRLK